MLTVEKIKHEVSALAPKYNVIKVDLFGSYASGLATEASDADFMVLFDTETPSIFKVMGLKAELGLALGHDVDIVTLPMANSQKMDIGDVMAIYERA